VMARVSPLESDRIEPGASVLVRLILDRPIGALARDRFVLRDATATRTIGGGVVIDPFPPRRGRRTPARLDQLAALQSDEPLGALLALPPHWTDRTAFFRAHNLSDTGQSAALTEAPAVPLADLLLAPQHLDTLRAGLLAHLAAHHAASPDQPGLQPERLRLATGRLPPAAFRALLDQLLRQRAIAQDGPWLRLPTHRVVLSPQDERLWQGIQKSIEADRFRPPRTRDLARELSVPEAVMRATLKRLQRMGRLIEVAPDQFFLRETMAEMAAIAAELAQGDGTLTAASFRDRLANGRKVAILILEFFDRAGVTVRTGDERRIRPERVDLFGTAGP